MHWEKGGCVEDEIAINLADLSALVSHMSRIVLTS